MKKFIMLGCAAMLASLASECQAGFVLSIDDGGVVGAGADVLITDNAAGDLDADAGEILFNGNVGNFTITVSAALSKPAYGSESEAFLDLNVLISSSTGGTLTVAVTDTGYDLLDGGSPVRLASGKVGGTANNSTVSISYFADTTGNAEFGMSNPIGDSPTLGPGAFANTESMQIPSNDPFSLTQVATITHNGQSATSFDSEFTVIVPEPTSMAIMGLGTLLAGFGVRRRKQKQLELSA